MGEFKLIREVFAGLRCARLGKAELGIGDDCALLQPIAGEQRWAISSDTLVSGTHFFPDVDPKALGHKALAVNLSDLAAMGARPSAFTLAITLPGIDRRWLDALAEGLDVLACEHACELIGGDTTRGPLSLSLTVFGLCEQATALRRSQARAGDQIWVSGTLGGAALALQRIAAGQPVDAALRARLEQPCPRVSLGLALRGIAHAAIDVSDGFVQDLGHVVEASGLGARVPWENIPLDPALSACDRATQQRCALAGGDDYELLFTAPADATDRIAAIGQRLGLALTAVGEVVAGSGVLVTDSGMPVALPGSGFDHFRAEAAP